MQGTNNYHNLTKISSREIYRRLKAKAPPRVAAEADDEQEQDQAEAEAEEGYVTLQQRTEGREKGARHGGCNVDSCCLWVWQWRGEEGRSDACDCQGKDYHSLPAVHTFSMSNVAITLRARPGCESETEV